MSNPIVLDCSVAMAWCFEDAAPSGFLIRPAPEWPETSWDDKAQKLHGIERDQLAREGVGAGEICKALNSALSDVTVYSDAPDWDGFWLMRLFQAGGLKQEFALRDFNKIFAGMDRPSIDDLIAKASKISPHCHRASDDVLHMRTIFKLIGPTASDH